MHCPRFVGASAPCTAACEELHTVTPATACADFTGLLIKDTWHELRNPTDGHDVPSLIWIGFCTAALTVSTLNYYWFGLMLRSVARVYLQGHTWTDISNNKND